MAQAVKRVSDHQGKRPTNTVWYGELLGVQVQSNTCRKQDRDTRNIEVNCFKSSKSLETYFGEDVRSMTAYERPLSVDETYHPADYAMLKKQMTMGYGKLSEDDSPGHTISLKNLPGIF